MSEEIQENKQFINLGVVLNDNGEVLLIRRVKEEIGKNSARLIWAFPGGKQRKNETREECVKREVLDETGYDIKPLKQISMRVHPQFTILVVYHLCRLISQAQIQEPREPHEVAEIRWVKPEEVEKMITSDLDPKVKKELGITPKPPIKY